MDGEKYRARYIRSYYLKVRFEMGKQKIDESTIKAIESAISKGDRAEVVPVKGGVKVLRVRKEVIKSNEDPKTREIQSRN